MVCRYCIDNEVNRAYRAAGFGCNLDYLIVELCKCEDD